MFKRYMEIIRFLLKIMNHECDLLLNYSKRVLGAEGGVAPICRASSATRVLHSTAGLLSAAPSPAGSLAVL